jgi:thiol-disulfide isomerase/thioredoxin
MNVRFFFFFLLLITNDCFSQPSSFLVNGRVEGAIFDSAELMFFKSDTTFKVDTKKVPISNKRFLFKGVLPHSYAAFIMFSDRNGYKNRTDIFFVDVNSQETIIFYDTSGKSTISSSSKTFNEFSNNFSLFIPNSLGKKISDSSLYSYTKNNPNSYVSLWMLLYYLTTNSYKPIYTSTYNILDSSLKKNPTGVYLQNMLLNSDKLKVGAIFPNIKVTDLNKNETHIESFYKNNRYILIDFWFSRCQPCIRQFPALTKLYKENMNRGFAVVSIASDQDNEKKNLNLVIKQNKFKWTVYWDRNSAITFGMLSITKFPTNVLLNSRGEILLKNVEPEDLEKFLSENLK